MDDLTNDELIDLLCDNGAEVRSQHSSDNGIDTKVLYNEHWEEPYMMLQCGSNPVPNHVLARIGKAYLHSIKPSES